jgi:hypothetical protein
MTPDVELQRLVKNWRWAADRMGAHGGETYAVIAAAYLACADDLAAVIGYTSATAPTPTREPS